MKKKVLSGLLTLALTVSSLTGMGQPVAAEETKSTIVNDVFWQDVSGNTIFSQGGGIFEFNDTYYWYGVKYEEAIKYAADPSKAYSVDTFAGVTCYSSKDLVNWTYEGDVVTRDEVSGHEEMGGEEVAWVGRLGVAYMEESGTYALFVQHECDDPDGSLDAPDMNLDNTKHDGYWSKQVLVLTCDTPDGEFKWNQRINMTDFTGGTSNTGDQTVFTDPDTGKDYLLYSFGRGRNKIFISEIVEQENGKVGIEKSNMIFNGAGREGNCMFKHNGKYYVCASDLYGWNASHAYYLTLDSLEESYLDALSPITSMAVMDGCSDDFCHVTQTGFFYTVDGTEQDTVIFCGDRWAGFAGNGLGFNQWCPLSFDEEGTPYFNSLSAWSIDMTTGEWTVDEKNNYAKNGSFDADRVSSTSLAGWTNTVTEGNTPIGNVNDRVTGKYALRLSDSVDFDAKVSQVVESSPYVTFPAGVYDLKAKVKNSGDFDTLNMFAKVNGVAYQYSISENHANYTEITLKDVVTPALGAEEYSVSDNGLEACSVQIGFEADGSAGAYCYVDDVTLVRADNQDVETGIVSVPVDSDTAKELTFKLTSEDGVSYEIASGDMDELGGITFSDIKTGNYTLTVTANACDFTNASQEITVTAGSTVNAEVVSVVNKAGDVTGKITDDKGNGIAGATVTLTMDDSVITTTTGADGTYTVSDIKAGTYSLSVEKAGYIAPDAKDVVVVTNETTEVEAISMVNAMGTVSGTVTDEDGNALSGATVKLRGKDIKKDEKRYTVTTDANGNYSASVIAGNYQVTATDDEDIWAVADTVVVGRDETVDTDLQMPVVVEVPNGEFESTSDWTNNGNVNIKLGRPQDCHSGNGHFNVWSSSAINADLFQTLTGLENGTYVLNVSVDGEVYDDDTLYIYAMDSDGEIISSEDVPNNFINSKNMWDVIGCTAEVTDGTLTIGIKGSMGAGHWVHVDEFRLGLIKKTSGEGGETTEVDKTALNKAIASAESLKEADYTAESWTVFAQALADAKKEAASASSTEETVAAALKALTDAQAALVKASTTPSTPEEPGTPADPSTPSTPTTPSKPSTPAKPEVAQVKVLKSKLTLGVKEKYTIAPTTLPSGSETTFTYKTSNKKVATVSSKGKITAKKTGKATITVTSANGKTATIKVTVKKAPGKITVTTKAKSLKKGKSFKIKYKLPKNTASEKITFKSSNKKVASVDAKGKVKALKKGKATITVKTFNGKTAKVKVTVK